MYKKYLRVSVMVWTNTTRPLMCRQKCDASVLQFIRTLESRPEFNARNKVYFASLLTVALHGKLEYYTDIMRTLLLELMEEYVHSKNPKLMLRR